MGGSAESADPKSWLGAPQTPKPSRLRARCRLRRSATARYERPVSGRIIYPCSLGIGLLVTAGSLYFSGGPAIIVGLGLSVYAVACWAQDRGEGVAPIPQPRDAFWPAVFGLYAFGTCAVIGLCAWCYWRA